jgi:hypothetical protein
VIIRRIEDTITVDITVPDVHIARMDIVVTGMDKAIMSMDKAIMGMDTDMDMERHRDEGIEGVRRPQLRSKNIIITETPVL